MIRLVRPRAPVDLTLPNAVGPETHVYHAMGVHLYMRKRGEAAVVAGGNPRRPPRNAPTIRR